MHPFAYVFSSLVGIAAEDRPHFKRPAGGGPTAGPRR